MKARKWNSIIQRDAQDKGIVIVHQELNMLGHLTVAQNIFIGREFKKGIRIDDKR